MPITASHSVVLPSVTDLPTVMAALAEMASGSSTGMFPANLFPGMNATRYGFSPTEDSFCMFHVPKTGGKTPQMPGSGSGAYGYGSHSGTYGGGYGGYIPGSYSAYGTHYDVVDLTGPTPTPNFPYGLPGPLAQLVQMLGAELDCLLAPVLPGSAPNFAVFIEVIPSFRPQVPVQILMRLLDKAAAYLACDQYNDAWQSMLSCCHTKCSDM